MRGVADVDAAVETDLIVERKRGHHHHGEDHAADQPERQYDFLHHKLLSG